MLFIVVCLPSHQQLFTNHPGYLGMEAYSTSQVDVFSFLANAASLAQLKSSSAGIFSERRFLLEEMNSVAAVAGFVIPEGKFALKMLYAGFNLFRQIQAGLIYARRLVPDVDAGIQFSYHGFQIAEYGIASGLSVGAGAVFHATEKLNTGIYINIPAPSRFGPGQQERWPATYRFGVGYETSPVAFVMAEIVKEENLPVDARIGIRYQVHPSLLVKAGIATATSSFWSGVGIMRRQIQIDIAVCYHPLLGVSPGLSVQFVLDTKQPDS